MTDDNKLVGPANHQEDPSNSQRHLPQNSQGHQQNSQEEPSNFQEQPQNTVDHLQNLQEKPQNLQELPSNFQAQVLNLQDQTQNSQEPPKNPQESGRHSPTFTEITNQFYKERYEGMITRIRLERSHYTACPNCNESIFTVPEYHVGVLCWVLCFVIAAVGTSNNSKLDR
ncbi:hypothetical protein HELRODRAFT_160846 [Helobdella robusta]|uniref:LITAF domain-containing protein n=1 Tax=Helobdella robusta TaxID=6412 RepID=T1EQT5_HELRO|nr:hypothetical protein HELRODRAFT_160846 [Helobdella robusta]ESO06656.1 hypothetical protein HELRODRAFT_160846 [Helobdella robusta]